MYKILCCYTKDDKFIVNLLGEEGRQEITYYHGSIIYLKEDIKDLQDLIAAKQYWELMNKPIEVSCNQCDYRYKCITQKPVFTNVIK